MLHDWIWLGLPGPTHHYGGHSPDNVAAVTHARKASHPREAALQTLNLARMLQSLGQNVFILPPQMRPHLPLLRTQFSGEPAELLSQAAAYAPRMLEQASSSSFMWAANAATVCPAADARDGKLHLSIANLQTHLHRRIEAAQTHRIFCALMENIERTMVHEPLDAARQGADEGAANHMRFSQGANEAVHLFVINTAGRQELRASEAIAAQHQLPSQHCIFLEQSPQAQAAGVFHHDVIAVNHGAFLMMHERAFADPDAQGKLPKWLNLKIITEAELSLQAAVETYWFNSQLIPLADGQLCLIAPQEVATHPQTRALADSMLADAHCPITRIETIDLRQSMNNGGGPACLRLRVPMDEAQDAQFREIHAPLLGDEWLDWLESWVRQWYPPLLTRANLAEIELYDCSLSALKVLEKTMRLPIL